MFQGGFCLGVFSQLSHLSRALFSRTPPVIKIAGCGSERPAVLGRSGEEGPIRTQAKAAFHEVLAPFREACRKAKVECEFGGTRSPDKAEWVFFLVEKVKDGLKVAIKGRPETEEVIPAKVLKESVNKAAYAFVGKWVGNRQIAGNKGGGLSNRFRKVLAEK